MTDDLETLIALTNAEMSGIPIPIGGAYRLLLTEMHPDLAELEFKELIYNEQTEVPFVYATSGGEMRIWLLPK